VQDDEAHLFVEAAEATELVEDAVAPQEIIGGCRQFVAVRTKLEPRGWTMVVEIALDDAILQHAAEGNSEAARRPSELPRQGEIAREQHGCSSGNGAPAGEKRARGAKARDEQDRNGRTKTASSTISVALCVAAAKAMSKKSPIRSKGTKTER